MTKYQSSKTYEENIDRIEGRHSQLYNYEGDFNIPLSVMDRTTNQKINKEIQDLNNPIEQLNLTKIHRAFHPRTKENTFSLVHLEYLPG